MTHVGILFCLYDHKKQLKEENIMAYMSEEGYKKLMAELKELETVERPKISAAIAEARDKGVGKCRIRCRQRSARYVGNAHQQIENGDRRCKNH